MAHFQWVFLRIPDAAAHGYSMDMKTVAGSLRNLRGSRERVVQVIAKITENLPGHISDHDLERYHLGMVKDEADLAPLKEHLLWCGVCIDRAEAAAQYVDTVRAAACRLPE
jgi:hypothetical protein